MGHDACLAHTMQYDFIDRRDTLQGFLRRLKAAPEIALDTEADNLHHYRNRICLLQVKTGDEIVLIDPLAGLDLSDLYRVLSEKPLVMHGSDFDLRLMHDFCGFRASEIFDTMLAAQLLGHARIGLASLLEEYLGLSVAKNHQKSDWSRRPLPAKMLDYAAEDVAYLFTLRDLMQEKLETLGRMEWMRQRCRFQVESGITGFSGQNEQSWRIAGWKNLGKEGLPILYELWHWREQEAERADRPPFKIVNNQYLTEIARLVEEGRDDWHKSIPASIYRRYRTPLSRAIERGRQRAYDTLPKLERNTSRRAPLNQEELRQQELFRAARDRLATRLEVDPTLIANRTQLTVLSRNPDSLREVLQPWQADLIEQELSATVSSSH